MPRLLQGGQGESMPMGFMPQGAFIVMPISFADAESMRRPALREGPRRDDSHSRSPITPRDRRERHRDDRGNDRRRPAEHEDSWDNRREGGSSWVNRRGDGSSWENRRWHDSRESDRDQSWWHSSSWNSQSSEWRGEPWSSSDWQQRPSWGRGNNKGRGRGRGNKGRGKGWNQWSPSTRQQQQPSSDAAVAAADDSWGNWGKMPGPAGARAKAAPPTKILLEENTSEEPAAPAPSIAFAEDDDDDTWQEAINNALVDPDRVPAVNEAWASGEISTIAVPADDAVALAAENFTSLHPGLNDLPKSIALRLFRAFAMAEVEPDPGREILEWEGVGWKATFVPITVKHHLYFKDAAADGALSYLTWGHGTDWKSLPYMLHEGLVRPQSWEKGSLPSSGFFSQVLNQAWSDYTIKHCVRRALAIPKGQQGPIILGQAVTPLQPSVISGGGNWRLHAACRVAGASRSPILNINHKKELLRGLWVYSQLRARKPNIIHHDYPLNWRVWGFRV